MTSWTRGAVVLATSGAVVCALAACSDRPDGVDGDLTGDWESLPEPSSFVPEAGVCHPEGFQPEAPLVEYQPVPCEEPHMVETVHVGSFDVDGDTPPDSNSDAHREAYAECDEAAAEYLGDGYRAGRLWLGVAVPSEEGWVGGARWFRCDLLEVESVYGDTVQRERPLAGALADEDGEDALRLGCYEVSTDDEDEVVETTPIACDEPHQAEYVGTWETPDDSYPEGEARYDGCREQVAEYADLPVDSQLRYRTGTIVDEISESEWAGGNRALRCYMWLPGEEVTGSLEGAGPDELPVRTQ